MKVIKILIIIILILFVILGVRIYLSNNKNTRDNSNSINLAYILNKTSSFSNYKYITGDIEKIRKNNIVRVNQKSTNITLIYDYNKKIVYTFNDEKKLLIKDKMSSDQNTNINYTHILAIDRVIENSKLIKKERINEKDTILIEFTNKKDNIDTIYYNIDINTGFPIKCKYKNTDGKEIEEHYSFEFNTVTDDDVKLPDLNNYKIVDNTNEI